MTTVTLEIPKKFSNIPWINFKNNVDLPSLFLMFWVDINFLISEKRYQDEYIQDLKNGDFIISNDF